MNEIKPPRWIDYLLDKLAPAQLAEEIQGDMTELFAKELMESGHRAARWRYVLRGIGFLTKRFFWRKPLHPTNHVIMLGSYFKMAKRSLLTHKATSFINIAGLVTGIASALALTAIIRYELSFDTFHSNPERIYRIVRVSGDDMSEFRSGVSFPVHHSLREEIPGLKDIVAVEYSGGALVDVLDARGETEKKFIEELHGFVFKGLHPSDHLIIHSCCTCRVVPCKQLAEQLRPSHRTQLVVVHHTGNRRAPHRHDGGGNQNDKDRPYEPGGEVEV